MTATDLWWPVIFQARWFAGKGRDGRLTGIRPLSWLVEDEDLAVRPELAEIAYPDGTTEVYHLLVAYRPEGADAGAAGVGTLDGRVVSDAPRDPEAIARLTPVLLRDGDDGELTTAHPRPVPEGDLTPRVFSGEQSNTNVLLGDTALLKVFRRLEPGANLDREITDRLLGRGITDVPVLYGWLSANLDGTGYDLAMLSQLLPDPEDGWDLACASVRDGSDFTPDSAALGRALREIHRALADTDATLAGDEVADLMTERLARAVEAAPVLSDHAPALRRVYDGLRGRRIAAQPIHGDFHLGQTLRTSLGWRIIDFEGEPMKSMAERRRPDSVWRDVAGMVRSFSYATSAADDPGSEKTKSWFASQRDTFLRAYCEQLESPDDSSVLTAYEADKAVYEVVYETRNRPAWVGIPLGALTEIASATPVAESRNHG